jgi:cobalt-zinc-cadmium efflux system membrane fusion protein
LDNLYINQPLLAYTNFNPSKKYPCKILLIGKDITNERSTSVHCHFEKYDKNLHPGMYMNAEIELKKSNALTVPNDAIVMFNNKQFVFVAENKNTFRIIEIKTGITGSAFTEIAPDFVAAIKNRPVVTNGAYTLLMKLKNTEEE